MEQQTIEQIFYSDAARPSVVPYDGIPNLAKAIIAVMKAVKGVEKSMDVGSGNSSYKGVSDREVKQIVGRAMAANGLCIIPISVKPKVEVSRWEELDGYGKLRQKQSVFTEVNTRYLLLHESGESMELEGYGHGVDSQDKGAGKATTYALKYALLYTFLVPTGTIDDSDTVHSDNIEAPAKPKPGLTDKAFRKLVERVAKGELDLAKKADEQFMLTSEQIFEIGQAYTFAIESQSETTGA